jgi:hypothetical protein
MPPTRLRLQPSSIGALSFLGIADLIAATLDSVPQAAVPDLARCWRLIARERGAAWKFSRRGVTAA